MVKPEFSGDTSMKKKTKGRRKIDIKKIEKYNSRQVTFSKRRTGLFKKAAETCVLTGAQISILVTSSVGRPFVFRHPNSDVLFDDYLTGADTGTATNSPPPPHMEEFYQHYVEVSRELEAEKKRNQTIPVSGGGLRWYDEAVDGLNVEEVQEYLFSIGEMKKKVLTRANELMTINNSSSFFGYNSIQPVDIPTNASLDGGFHVRFAGDGGNF